MVSNPRIVSLCPSNTELVHALGLADHLVGVDNYSDYPANVVAKLPKLGPDLHIRMDTVVALKPDLTLASLSVPGMERVVAELATTGLPYLVLCPHSIDDIFADMRSLANALGRTVTAARTDEVIGSLRKRVDRAREATSHITERPKLYWEWWPSPVFSPAKNNWLTEVSQLAGAVNIFAEMEGDQVQDDGNLVPLRLPDYFLAVWTGIPQQKVPVKKLLHRAGWDTLPAIQQRKVYVLSEGLFCRPSPRLINGLEQLVGLLHPYIAANLGLHPAHHYAPVRAANGEWLGGVSPT